MPNAPSDRLHDVLEDLYALDPSLRAQEKDLEQVVAALLKAKPDVTVDKHFVRSLRSRLMPSAVSSFTQPTFMEKLTKMFVLPTAAIATIAVVAAVTVSQLPTISTYLQMDQPESRGGLAYGVTVSHTSDKAFGALSNLSAGGMGGGNALSARSSGGGGGPAYDAVSGMAPTAAPMPATAQGTSAEKMVSNDAMIARPIMPPNDGGDYTYERPRYVFDGDLGVTLDPQVSVYRRLSHPLNVGSLLKGLSFNGLNLSSFGDAALQQFSLVQSGQFGYQIYVDLTNGSASISQNYASWPHPEVNCRDQACNDSLQLKASEVPEDASLITIADGFLQDHGISKANFGTPVVDRRWGRAVPMAAAADGAKTELKDIAPVEDMKMMMPIYVPDSITVTYPLVVDGSTVYDQSGYPYGLSMTIDVRNKRVSNVWNLQTLDYQASSYDAITDAKEILDIASRGDLYSAPFAQDPNEKIHDVKLGQPEKVLMQAWHTNADGQGEELLVPTLRFPVKDNSDQYGYRDAVMVPLVKDLLNSPVIMYMKGGVGMGGGSAGSGVIAPGVQTTPASAPTPSAPPSAVAPKY